MRIGFIGTGTISAAVIEGLQSLPEVPEIVVSPRSEGTSLALAARWVTLSVQNCPWAIFTLTSGLSDVAEKVWEGLVVPLPSSVS